MGCRAIPTPVSGAHGPLPFFDLGVYKVFFSYFFFSYSSLLCSILPFFKYIFPEVPSPCPRGLAVPCGGVGWRQLEPAVSSTAQP